MIAEIPQDTTRAIANLLLTGTFSTFPDIRFIFAHAGGTVPMVADRMRQYASRTLSERVPKGWNTSSDVLTTTSRAPCSDQR
jgi:6-methylsalicylate decarboxylase